MTKCVTCNKKTLMIAECRCTKKVCLTCLQPDKHACTFDYGKEVRELLTQQNPIVKRQKIDKV